MKRREFTTLIGGVAAACPLIARGQEQRTRVVGYLVPTRPDPTLHVRDALREGLAGAGFVESKNLSIEYRYAEQHLDRLPGLALDLVQRRVDAIFVVGDAALQAARSATQIVPIVAIDFTSDPIEAGMAASLAHPGGNVTGIFLAFEEIATKWLELLKAAIPHLSRIAVLWDSSEGLLQKHSIEGAAGLLKVSVDILEVRSPTDFEDAFHTASQRGADALLMLPSPRSFVMASKVAELSIHGHLPSFFWAAEFARAGGFMAYGPNNLDTFRQAGFMVAKVLRGTNPADLPIERPTKFELIINLKTAKAIGLTIPDRLLALADEVIE